jgi:protocatechuate 3,4-dioxygenase, beta subunit
VSERTREVAPASSDAAVSSQSEISDEIARLAEEHRPPPGTQAESRPRLDYPPYRSSALRHPTHALHRADPEEIELWSPVFGYGDVDPVEADLTVQHGGDPIGERMTLTGRVLDGDGRPVRRQLVEIWQANAAGRYAHGWDRHPAPLDPSFSGAGRCMTDDAGRYAFTTVKPGAYPWGNHHNAWRPAHIHFSLVGPTFGQRLVTQMYFPGDPLHELDPIFNSVRDPAARERMVARFSIDATQPDWALGYEFDVVLRGPRATPFEEPTR